ncbi:uncharacterized protein LOC107614504 isoform X2 [Arachis ipaensis]|uniref:uncharacterized protein LOC107614504 isoform X2 n=1 Tax=Arachis ipaensis TaxID=130454 RepID=UPI000A2B720A|nr:uncharacterized protein LOC107614504 isoform X2 [Arachis ipaensis]XP_025673254.1 uncharacterized protein LOC112772503 isoform X2 [Arachis hypogaea]
MVESSEINRSLLALLDENIADAHRSSQKQAAEYMEKLRGALLKYITVRIFPQLEEIQLRRMEKLKDIWPHEDEDGRLKDQLRNDNFSSLQVSLLLRFDFVEK